MAGFQEGMSVVLWGEANGTTVRVDSPRRGSYRETKAIQRSKTILEQKARCCQVGVEEKSTREEQCGKRRERVIV